MALDPHTVHHVASSFAVAPHVDLHAVQLLLSDAAAVVSDTAAAAAETATEAKKSGWWDSIVNVVETAIVSLHGRLSAAGVPGAYGLSIILFTVVIKAFTFPLNFRQMESTMRMQAISPRLKKIQAEYKDNPQVMNQMTAQLYKDENINPLAGCLPVIVQIPVWIALYRSVLNLAADNLLNESFLWLPSLQGPVSKTGQGLNTWLFPLQNGAPPIGWHDAACYLVLPVILVATQVVSQRVMSPPSQDPSQQQANAILKFMPLLIGWFALNVPSGLGVYWVTNNLLSTAQTMFIRSRFPELATPSAADTSATTASLPDSSPSRLDVADGFRSNGTDAPKKTTKSKKRRKRR
ncbi:Membrane insertase YidC/ALB3/OXA1/COX18 [Gracilaria domingensis]|nr:Membrane insertase YidC/ALB3/OXA1/COX18 [Gracilaria domingensis]